jgi:uncharacterized surface protein with fasciclin (FAS1) repeats
VRHSTPTQTINVTIVPATKPEAKAALTGILTYHVIAGKHLAADVMKMTSAATVNG